jgi:hypothetical protein
MGRTFILKKGGKPMAKVKTFTTEIKPLHAMNELRDLDQQVNAFIENNVKSVISVSDTCTTSDKSTTIGIIRVLAYE